MNRMSPMSLQEQCFLYLLLKLEVFPWFHLAQLPMKMRSQLLMTLPLADVFQLQGTTVSMASPWIIFGENYATADSQCIVLNLPNALMQLFNQKELLSIAAVYASLHDQCAITPNEPHKSASVFLGTQTSPSKTWMLYEKLLFMVPPPNTLSAVNEFLAVEAECTLSPVIR